MGISVSRHGRRVLLLGTRPGSGNDGARYLAALEEIGAIDAPYVLLVSLEQRLELTAGQKKAQNLWYKATRNRVNAWCRACAILRADADGARQEAFGKLFAFPLLVTKDSREAEAFLSAHDVPEPDR